MAVIYNPVQLRRDTAANWTANNPILLAGQLGYETDTNKFKFGDGVSTWTVLNYFAIGSGISGVSSFNARTGAVVPATNDYTWAQVNKATSNIADITTKSHTSLTDIGTNTHPTIDTFIASKSNANGLASLDGGGKVPTAQLPSALLEYLGTWNATTNTPTLADGTGIAGSVYICTVAGTVNFGSGAITFALNDWVMYNGTIWEKSINSNAVVSVNSYTGIVTLAKADVGLGLVENTALSTWAGTTNITTLGILLGLSESISTKTANYTLTSNDYTILGNDSVASFTLTLPAVAANTNRIYNIKKINSSINTITVQPNASETIDGSTTYVIRMQNESITIQSNGTSWFIL